MGYVDKCDKMVNLTIFVKAKGAISQVECSKKPEIVHIGDHYKHNYCGTWSYQI